MQTCLLLRRIGPILACMLLVLSAKAESVDELIKKGDILDENLEPEAALKCYLPAEKVEPKNASLLVHIARQYRHLMSDATDVDQKSRLGKVAVGYSRRALVLAPNDPETHLSLAISLGKIVPFVGNKERLEASREVKLQSERVVSMDPANDLGWHVLGRWHLTMAGVSSITRALASAIYGAMPEASYEEAVKCFKKAIALNPSRPMHFLELGRTYSEMGQDEEAKKYITKGLSMPNTERDDPEAKTRGKAILKELH